MGTQGLSGHAVSGGRGDIRAARRPITILAVSLAILPLAAGCSGSSLPSFGSSGQQATVPPPPTGSVAATGQPAYAPPGQPAVQPGAYAAAPPAQPAASPEPGTVGSLSSSYVNFLKAFRDPEPDSAAPGAARPPAYAQQPAAPQQNAYVPHPPSTYVPVGQPYVPPQGQSAEGPPAGQQNYAAPPPAQQQSASAGQQSSAAASTKRAKAQRTPPQQNAAAAPAQPAAVAPAVAAPAPPAAQRDYSDSLPYPKQSLADVFSNSTESEPQSVPRPPSTYTPSGQPYTPQGQAAAGGAVAAAPAASQNSSNSLPYPKQSLFELFSNDK